MNCDGFDQRMNELLDERRSIDDDPVLQMHLLECDDCFQKTMIWHQVEGSLTMPPQTPRVAIPWSRVAVLAAGFLLAVVLLWDHSPERPSGRMASLPSMQQQSPAPTDRLKEPAGSKSLDPNRWWSSVEPGQWISQTMPTVRTVRESVRPLSRSFQQAVDLLTFGRAT